MEFGSSEAKSIVHTVGGYQKAETAAPLICNGERFRRDPEQMRGGQTWGEAKVSDDVFAVVEGHHVLQSVGVDDEEAAVIETHCQGFAVRREGAAAPP